MFGLGLIEVIQAEREREIQLAIRRRRLLRPQDDAIEPMTGSLHPTPKGRALTARVGPTGG
jgi:hypothetical protein